MSKQISRIVVGAAFVLLVGICASAGASGGAAAEEHGAATHAAVVEHAAPAGHAAAVEHAAPAGHGEMTAHQAGGHQAAAHGGGHGEAHPMVTPAKLKDLFWRVVNFIALVIILVYFLARPIGDGLEARRRGIKEELEGLEARRDEARKEYKAFEERLAGMEKEMESVVEKAVAQAEAEKERILAEAERAAEDIKRQAEAAVAAEIIEARRNLRDQVAEQAAAMAEELIKANLTDEDHVNIIDQYLAKVEAVQ